MGLSHPVWGRLWRSEQHKNGATLRKADFINIALEAEFAITLKQSLSLYDWSSNNLVSAIDSVYPVIEVHNLVMNGKAPRGPELIANNCIHSGLILGPRCSPPTSILTTDLALVFDGNTVDSWDSLHWPHNMLSAIKWLAQQLANINKHLKNGDLILTGAFGPPILLDDRIHVDVTSSAFGKVSAKFV
jgi:2-keto-4-pentenoate hydratase